ncbi:hypothetical protein [Pantoea vagans]|uniref:hypothetical protein n=1 Tax=Pantoea vagans TaxID=470934 RepID=UPI00320B2FCD
MSNLWLRVYSLSRVSTIRGQDHHWGQFGVSAVCTFNKYVDLTAGIDNFMDKRHLSKGNSNTTGVRGPMPMVQERE